MPPRLVILALLAGAVAGAALWLSQAGLVPENLGDLRAIVAPLQDRVAAAPLAAGLAGLGLYAAVTALSLPVAVWLTLAAGALFGFWGGLAVASLGATLGATLACAAVRYLARDWARARLGTRAQALLDGVERDGAFYLFSLRLVPVVPFFAINLGLGLTAMPLARFAWVSLAGMLPGTAVFVNAGTQLAQVEALGDIVSAPILASFAALAALPWLARLALGLVRKRRALARWQRPKRYDVNLLVIGAGAAGLVATYMATALKARVTLVQDGPMGGDCLNTGCVPSKALLRAARAVHEVETARAFGIHAGTARVDWAGVMGHVQRAIDTIAPHDSAARYRAMGAEVIAGRARLTDPWTVQIDTPEGPVTRTARAIVLATGATPALPPVPGLAELRPLTSDTLWARLADPAGPPARVAILGGGAIGCEMALALSRLGIAISVIEAAPCPLPREEPEASALAEAALRSVGVALHLGVRATGAGGAPEGVWLDLDNGVRVQADEILAATGRRARLAGMGLADLGLPEDAPLLPTDPWLRSALPHIHAAGDVTGPLQFTHAAGHQGVVAAVNALTGLPLMRADRAVIPRVTYLDPEIASAGLTEAEAAAKSIAVDITHHDLTGLDRAVAEGAGPGFVKLLTAKGRDRILGVTIVAPAAGEMLAEVLLAMRAGLGAGRILATVHPYPTWSDGVKLAMGAWRRGRPMGARSAALLAALHRHRRREGRGDDA